MSVWYVVLAVGLGSYVFRAGVVLLADRGVMPASVQEASEFVAPVAFTTLAATGVAQACLGVAAVDALAPLVAVAVAVIAVARTGRPWVAMIVGLPTLWLLNAVLALGVRYGHY
jgi:branched-subunit amino acid transport protein